MLTKEECLEALKQMTSSCEGNEDFCLKNCDACSVIKQLINEHFDNNNARTVQNLVSEIDKLEKALDKACLILENIDNRCAYFEKEFYKAIGKEVSEELEVNTKEEWKEWCLKDE